MRRATLLDETIIQCTNRGQLFVYFPKAVKKNFPIKRGVKVLWLSSGNELILKFKPERKTKQVRYIPVLDEEE